MVRQWLDRNVPDSLRHLTFRPAPDKAMQWYRKVAKRGWIAPHWPRAYGGMGATPVEEVLLMEEWAAAGAPDIPTQGLNHIGPILMKLGSEKQRQDHLRPILQGDVIWCQGYSEAAAGSDLASLGTRAEQRADRLIINGQKIWTTWGQHADWMFALVRTSASDEKRKGITFVLINLTSSGVTRRPIQTIAGDEEFCEVFFDDVQVPIENVVGDLDHGWAVATTLLSEERLRVGTPLQALRALTRLRMLVAERGVWDDPAWSERLGSAEIETETLIAAYLEVAEAHQVAGAGVETSYLKVLATETVQHILDILQELAGPSRGLRMPKRTGSVVLDFSEMFLQARRLSIYAGSNEIQRNLIASRVLHMGGKSRSRK